MNRKGFTLVELLATILIIGLVVGLTAYGIISSVNSAKGTGETLSLSGVKEAASTYSGEFTDDSWKNINDYDDLYFCVTVEELINKGLLDKNAKEIENGGKLVDYVVVIKNKVTRVISKEQLLTNNDQQQEDAYGICTGNIKNEVIESGTKIDNSTSYTDTIDINFTDPKFETNITDRYCEYGISSSNLDKKGTAGDGVCTLDGLSQETSYYTRVCATSERKSVSCSDTISVSTKKIMSPGIEISTDNSVKITYNNTNIKGDGYYYFKSTMDATSDKNVVLCDLDGKISECESSSSNRIAKATWYRTTNKEVVLTYKDSGNVTIIAETRDKSNNSKQSSKDFSLYKIIFDKGTADTIGGQSDNIEKLCIANKGKTCSITSPSIERSGYNIIGWNTNSSATTSSWNVNTSKNISTSTTYYPIVKISTYTISYNANGGSSAPSSQTKNYNVNITLSSSKPTRVGYTFTGWNTKTDGTGTSYASGATYSSNSDVTLYAQWKVNKINIYYHMNGGTLKSNNSSFGTSGNYVTLNGNTLIESYNYGDKLGVDGLYNYNNSGYINIVRSGYKAVSGSEWYNQDGKKFNQSTIYNANDLCDASSGDCAATLYVNWVKEDTINDYRCATSGSDYYYITTCDTNTCNYSSKNGSSGSGTVSRNSLKYCNKVTFYPNGGTFSNGASSFFFMATPGTKYYFNSSYYLSGIGMPTISKSGCSLSGWYFYPESKVIYSWFDVSSEDYNVELKANWYCGGSSSGGGDSGSGDIGNGCPTGYPKRFVTETDIYCCSPGTTDPHNLTGSQKCQTLHTDDGSYGFLASCTCDVNKDCGTAGTKTYINLYCNRALKSDKTTGGKYMCSWNTIGSTAVNSCW